MTDSRQTAGELAGEIKDTFTARGQVYGPPEINFANIAAFWNAWIHARYGIIFGLDAIDVAQMSSLIKKARLANSPDHRDSALDDATYTLLGAGVAALHDPLDLTSAQAIPNDFGNVENFAGVHPAPAAETHGDMA